MKDEDDLPLWGKDKAFILVKAKDDSPLWVKDKDDLPLWVKDKDDLPLWVKDKDNLPLWVKDKDDSPLWVKHKWWLTSMRYLPSISERQIDLSFKLQRRILDHLSLKEIHWII